MSFWEELRASTEARIGLGRSGTGLPTRALLDFRWAHAQACDAVSAELDRGLIEGAVAVQSCARTREEFLLRPDLGRRLNDKSRERLATLAARTVLIVADGLSATAVERHAPSVVAAIREREAGWPVLVATQARVALSDSIGEVAGADLTVMLIGERPGLSAPDSLGIYVTWNPRPGRTDAERNCISNVRHGGLSYAEAVHRLFFLIGEARRLCLTGVQLKESAPRLLG